MGGNAPENDGIKTAPTSPTRQRGSAGRIPARRASEGRPVGYQPDAPARVGRSDTSPTRQRGSAGPIPARRASEGRPVTETASVRGRTDRRRTLAGASGWYSDGPPTDPRWRVQPVWPRSSLGSVNSRRSPSVRSSVPWKPRRRTVGNRSGGSRADRSGPGGPAGAGRDRTVSEPRTRADVPDRTPTARADPGRRRPARVGRDVVCSSRRGLIELLVGPGRGWQAFESHLNPAWKSECPDVHR